MKTTLITCATSGMGSAIAQSITGKLIVTGRNSEKLSKLCSTTQIPCQSVRLDFSCDDSIEQAAAEISAFDKLDQIVFIIPRIPPSQELFPDSDAWQALYQDFFIRPLSLMKYLVENQRLNQRAKIVLVSGLSSKNALSHYSTNNCLRSAWLGQAKTMALVLGAQGISVNTLSLGGVMTESYTNKMHAKAELNGVSFEQQMAEETSNIPLKKYASVQDVVDAVNGLLGPLSNHMTGQNILLDGGFFKGY
ncbi:SDR family oxidoreductase [Vibrio bivalvicida]|uniref:Short-chain dehydrogenase n=1 Tax=Vibrio bivalvicida TaxID=1276888 RepID=A0A177XZM3_9VIBR|nr:SDR family oxidoreductase [Vibrio bivalvicida]OAJ94059.1 short-chain dehydrogenase [Vibrio bivalvicida]